MKVVVEYTDTNSFLPEEVLKQAESNYGKRVKVSLSPDSDTPIDHLYFAVQRMLTGDLLSTYYDSGSHFNRDLELLKKEFLFKVAEVVDDVVLDTLNKLSQE